MRGTTKGALLALAISSAASGTAQAGTRNARFEPPAYTFGTVDNKQGWVSAGAQHLQLRGLESGLGPDVLDGDAARGRGAHGGERRPFGRDPPAVLRRPLDVRVGRSGAEQAGLSVVVGPDRGDGAQMSWVQMADKPGGIEVNFRQAESGATLPIAANLPRNVPHTIRISMEFVPSADNDVVKVFVDDVLRHTGGSWEQTYRALPGANSRTVDSLMFRTSGAAAPSASGFSTT